MTASDFEIWDLDPADGDRAFEGGPYRAERAEVLSAGGRSTLVALYLRGRSDPHVVRCWRGREGAWIIYRQIAEPVAGREAEALEEMRGYALADLERLAAEDAARAAARADGCACDLPAVLAPLAAAAEGVEAGDACGEEATARQTLDLLHLRRQRGACLCDAAGRSHPPALTPGRVARAYRM